MFSILQKIFTFSCAIACLTAATSKRQFLSVQKYTKGSHSKFFDLCSQFNFFTQSVDHFGFNQVDTYQQRYIISDKYWQGAGSPIFFYTGNEGDIQWFCENTGFVWEQAEQLGALVVFAEHRYYGNSMPYGAESYSKANLNYLTSEQALADYAYLIKSIKSSRPETQKSAVIAFGGSYGGMLAAWFRMKYPNIVTGALGILYTIFRL
jgi:lysosomal Pro-X carboxypeptidase